MSGSARGSSPKQNTCAVPAPAVRSANAESRGASSIISEKTLASVPA
jgi:hypothetical protein